MRKQNRITTIRIIQNNIWRESNISSVYFSMADNSEIPFKADFEVTVVHLTNDLIAKIEKIFHNFAMKMNNSPVDMWNLNRDLNHLFRVARKSAELVAKE